MSRKAPSTVNRRNFDNRACRKISFFPCLHALCWLAQNQTRACLTD